MKDYIFNLIRCHQINEKLYFILGSEICRKHEYFEKYYYHSHQLQVPKLAQPQIEEALYMVVRKLKCGSKHTQHEANQTTKQIKPFSQQVETAKIITNTQLFFVLRQHLHHIPTNYKP